MTIPSGSPPIKMPVNDQADYCPMLARVLWIVLPLLLAIAGIETGLLTLPNGGEPLLSIAEIACGVLIVIVLAQALLLTVESGHEDTADSEAQMASGPIRLGHCLGHHGAP